MIYRLLADATVLLHLGFVLFVVAGGLLVLRRRWLTWLHLPAVLWAIYIEWNGGVCPLTPLENYLRDLSGQDGYSGGFVEHYLIPLLYPDQLTRLLQYLFGTVVLAVNIVLYWTILKQDSHNKKR